MWIYYAKNTKPDKPVYCDLAIKRTIKLLQAIAGIITSIGYSLIPHEEDEEDFKL